MAYDSGIVSFTTKTNKVDLVDAAHINTIQEEIVRTQTILGTGLKGTAADLSTRLNISMDSDGSILSGTSFPSPALYTSRQFWRTDLNTLYVYTGSSWAAQSGATQYVAGTYLIGGPTPISTSVTVPASYTKVGEVYIPRSGTLTITFEIQWLTGAGQNVNGRIYRNGSAIGTERVRPDGNTTYTSYSEDISGWAVGDLCQLYVSSTSGSATGTYGNMVLYENAPNREINSSTYQKPVTRFGAGVPNTSMGNRGDLYIRTDGGATTTLYVKTDASTWTAK